MVHGKSRHSQSQGSVERANQDVENMLATWMKDNNTSNWSRGLPVIQFMKNRAYHSGIKQSPYRAMFGIEPRVGLATSALSPDMLVEIVEEDDLLAAVEHLTEQHQSSVVEHEGDNSNVPVEIEFEVPEEEQIETEEGNAMANVIALARKSVYENLKLQAKRMKLSSDATHPPVEVGANVLVPIPEVDRAKADFRNLLGVVVEKQDDLHRIGTAEGILNKLYCRSEFDTTAKFVTLEDVPIEKAVSLRTAARKAAIAPQGFSKCACKKACISRRCCCKKRGVLCNSKCHDSQSYNNK
ncbi:hypothetical protein JTE90_023691 [Oedothorax gibbosus]|uniref:Integrase catalytic domain-containing protein n=1 Tax=Oedothorax gibbosus TaxID=931172 RepID=A0AAV6TP20_9ARAC|nr:hypothetical protein JTE90_023691 [Oedothorax gibbosus]